MPTCSRYLFNVLPDLVSDLSLLSWRHAFPGAGNGEAFLFHDTHHARHPGDDYCPFSFSDALSRLALRLRQTQTNRAVDTADLVVCFRYRCDCLPNALPSIPDSLNSSRWKPITMHRKSE